MDACPLALSTALQCCATVMVVTATSWDVVAHDRVLSLMSAALLAHTYWVYGVDNVYPAELSLLVEVI